jgi:hypothetical protein
LDLLGFIRPNRDFSMGYGEKNKKIPLSLLLAAGRLARGGFDPASGQRYSMDSDFRKEIARARYSRPNTGDPLSTRQALRGSDFHRFRQTMTS